MAITEIIHFSAELLLDATKVNDTVQKSIKALEDVKTPEHFVLGTQVQDKSAVQITSERGDIQDDANSQSNPESSSLTSTLRPIFGEPRSLFHVALDRSVFGPAGPATSNVVEYVQTYFPASRVTPEFQKQIEDDFARFDEIFMQGTTDGANWTSGWVLEELEHEKLAGEKAKCFLVVRGWDRMENFELSVKTEAFKKAGPILFAWGAPFAMWHVERKASDSSELVS